MKTTSRRHRIRFALLGLPLVALLFIGPSPIPTASAITIPSLKLINVDSSVTILRHSAKQGIPVFPSMYIEAVGGDFELQLTRANYDSPFELNQIIDGGAQVIPLDPTMYDPKGGGLKSFMQLKTTSDATGLEMAKDKGSFCPSDFGRQRIDPESVPLTRYPLTGCGGNPFMKGAVWGIEQGWASKVVGGGGSYSGYYYGGYYGYGGYGGYGSTLYGLSFHGPDGNYTTTGTVMNRYLAPFNIQPGDETASIHITVQTKKSCSRICFTDALATRAGDPPVEPQRSPAVPVITDPPNSLRPDLVPLPSYDLRARNNKKSGAAQVEFTSTIWNNGPADFAVEGYRQLDQPVMDAFQYFYKDGQPIGRAPTGQLSLDTADRGSQWSYNDFATYQVFDEAMTPVTPVQGLSFCLQSSSAIDLTVKGATWQPANDTLASSCATAGALWTREVLDSGWGSTNYSYRSGQSFDITNLPNGHYFVQIQANPNGTILERNLQNNSATRAIIIKGRPGHRTVVALPYHNVYAP